MKRDLDDLARLLAEPDPPELARRGHHVTIAGDPRRRQTVLLPLLVRWAQRRCLAVDPEPYIAPARIARERLRRVK